MRVCRPIIIERPVIGEIRRAGVCDRLLIGLVAITLVRAGEALAGEQASEAGAIGKLEPNDTHQSTELPASAFGAPEANAFSPQEFRRRGHSIFESDTRASIPEDKLINDSPVWQRLSEFRTHDRIRVLTLWKSGLSSVSLQAGKKGNPTLQWTSRMMNSGEGADGLLDRLLPASSVGGRGMAHAGIAQPLAKGEPAGKAAALVGTGRTSLP